MILEVSFISRSDFIAVLAVPVSFAIEVVGLITARVSVISALFASIVCFSDVRVESFVSIFAMVKPL